MRAAVIRTEDITERQWELLYGQLSEARRQKADRIHLLAHRRESIAAGVLWNGCCGSREKRPPFSIAASANGKPFLIGRDGERKTGVYFSITHTKGLAGAVVGEVPVGLDAERIRPYPAKVAARYFSPAEQKLLEEGNTAAFYRIWTKKEALAKLLDLPLLQVMERPEDEPKHIRWHIRQVEEWVVALCEEREDAPGERKTGAEVEVLTAGSFFFERFSKRFCGVSHAAYRESSGTF